MRNGGGEVGDGGVFGEQGAEGRRVVGENAIEEALSVGRLEDGEEGAAIDRHEKRII